jgi:hypothetical protein
MRDVFGGGVPRGQKYRSQVRESVLWSAREPRVSNADAHVFRLEQRVSVRAHLT